MHTSVIVVTKDKPTEDVLATALAPFGPVALGPAAHWDWWALGGTFTGLLIPHDLANTITGGPDISPAELAVEGIVAAAGVTMTRLGDQAGPGVDALQHRNFKELLDGWMPLAIVIDGHWHQCEIYPVEPLLRSIGRIDEADRHDFSEERAAGAVWDEKAIRILDVVPSDHWISVVDIHN
jgi:hypothetical protein